jgi:glycosyltransferase involved in cell wall biosynthesis
VVYSPGPGRRSAAAELVEHGVSGLHVDFGDPDAAAAAIGALLADAPRREAMGQAAARTAATLDRFDYIGAFGALIDEVMAEP